MPCIFALDKVMQEENRDILFPPDLSSEWDNQRWLSSNAKLHKFGIVYRFIKSDNIFTRDQLCRRFLALYTDPHIILVLRKPIGRNEIKSLLHVPMELEDSENSKGNSLVDSFLVTEAVIDLMTCKLRLSKLTSPTCICDDDGHKQNVFELIYPNGNVLLSLHELPSPKDIDTVRKETAIWEEVISQALFFVNKHLNCTPGWKHHLVIGSLHSYVLHAQTIPLERVLSSTREMNLVDRKDEDGLTALHYACLTRNFMATSTLISAGADCRMKTADVDGRTPCHISAALLDEKSLSIMLSTSSRHRPDPNALDALGRTPMYVAIIDGKNVHGALDHILLVNCLNLLEEWGGQMMIEGALASYLPHPIYVLSTHRRFTDLSTAFNYCNYRFDLELDSDNDCSSIASRFHYPIHASLLILGDQLVHSMQTVHAVSDSDYFGMQMSIVSCLQILLEHGIEPNERIEYVENTGSFAATLELYVGYAPLQILYAVHSHLTGIIEEDNQEIFLEIKKILSSAAEILVEHGARILMSPPPHIRPHRKIMNMNSPETNLDDSKQFKWDKNSIKGDIFESENKMNDALNAWSETKIPLVDWIAVDETAFSAPLLDSHKPGGNDSKSCSICWKDFTAFKVSKKERVICVRSKRYICHDCSTKGFTDGVIVFKTSDGQFNVLRRDAEMKLSQDTAKSFDMDKAAAAHSIDSVDIEDSFNMGQTLSHFHSMVSKEVGNATDRFRSMINDKDSEETMVESNSAKRASNHDQEKESLFYEAMNKMQSFFTSPFDDVRDMVESESRTMDQTRNMFNQRGEKLASLAEKTASLKDSTEEFMRLTKELSGGQKSSRGFF